MTASCRTASALPTGDRRHDRPRNLESQILGQIAAAGDEAALEAVRVAALGKKGSISALLSTLGKMSPDERKTQGAAINLAKDKVTHALTARRDILKSAALDARLASETIDVTLPLREAPAEQGRIHPLSQVMDELTRSSPTWDLPSPKVRTSRPTTTTSPN